MAGTEIEKAAARTGSEAGEFGEAVLELAEAILAAGAVEAQGLTAEGMELARAVGRRGRRAARRHARHLARVAGTAVVVRARRRILRRALPAVAVVGVVVVGVVVAQKMAAARRDQEAADAAVSANGRSAPMGSPPEGAATEVPHPS
ncbi:MAG TPA: hypothetical protein VKG43_12465 [Acidimicrobiales bacterium]|nr:hypothetical protein [Acidimicrobiales bacterium]